MLEILHSPFQQPSLPIRTSVFENRDVQNPADLKAICEDPYIEGLVGGRLITMDREGVVLADGALSYLQPMGFIIVDACYEEYYNRPGIASYRLAYAPITPGVVVYSDQTVSGEVWRNGDAIYCGTNDGTNNYAGLLTKESVGTGGVAASVTIPSATVANGNVTLTYKQKTAQGNAYRVKLVDGSTVLIARSGYDITITLNSGTTTAAQLKTAWDADSNALNDIIDMAQAANGNGSAAITVATADESFRQFTGGMDGVSKRVGHVELRVKPTFHKADSFWLHCG